MSDLFGGLEGEGVLQPTFRATQEQAAIMLERNSRVYDYIHKNPSEAKLFNATTESGAECAGANATSTSSQAAPDMPCLLYTSPSPRDRTRSRMPSSA